MTLKFNINRPKVNDDELMQHQDFGKLVRQFKEQSLKQAKGDESWWKNKKVQYATIIAGVTVICTITYSSISNKKTQQTKTNETISTQKKETKPSAPIKEIFIKEPSKKLGIGYTAYKVDNSKAAIITHSSGSKIKIPKNCFVNKQGYDIKGEVTIEYREFHDHGDIIVSGIPMRYDSAGTVRYFESAGMFDIRGYHNGEPAYIKANKTLSVELASKKDDTRFNQYYLDTLQKNWRYLSHDRIKPLLIDSKYLAKKDSFNTIENKKIKLLKQQITKVIPKQIDSVKTVYTNRIAILPVYTAPVKPEAHVKGIPIFKIDGSYEEFPELAAFENVVFAVGNENHNYSSEFQNISWTDIKISEGPAKGKNYRLTLSTRQRKEQLIVYPVIDGASYEKARATYNTMFAQYEQKKEKRLADEKRLFAEMQAREVALLAQQKKQEEELKKENALLAIKSELEARKRLVSEYKTMSNQTRTLRLFEVSRFGIYNSDCPHYQPGDREVNPVFILDNKPVHPHTVYIINHTYNMVMCLSAKDGLKFRYQPGVEYSLCVFNKDIPYFCNKDSFRKTADESKQTFEVLSLQHVQDNLADFKKELGI